jgi:spermidine synthase
MPPVSNKDRSSRRQSVQATDSESDAPARPSSWSASADLYVVAFLTGSAVMVVEILGTRVIGPVFGVSLFVWSALIAVTLCSLAAGYYVGGAMADRRPTRRLLAGAVIAGGLLLGLAAPASSVVLPLGERMGPRLGPLVAAIGLFGPALAALGMVGPIVVRLATNDLHATGHRVGTVYAVSTAGSLLATLVTAFVLIPAFETSHILAGTALVVLAVGAVPLVRRGQRGAALLLVVPFLGLAAPEPKLPAGIAIVARTQSPYGSVEVIDDSNRKVRFLRADHSIIGGAFTEDRTAPFAFLHILESLRFLRPQAKELLQIGLGAGSLASSLRPFGIKVDVVEIDPEVVRMAKQYFGFSTDGNVYVEDARTYMRRTNRTYDLIVHDTFTGGATPEHLLSVEVLRRARSLLRPGGILALNIPGYVDGPKAAASEAVARALHNVFPVVRAFQDADPATNRWGGFANIVFFASDTPIDLQIPDNAQFEDDTCKDILQSFTKWEVLRTVPAGPLLTDQWNPLARLQLPVTEDHFRAMNELLPREVWLR